MGGRTGGRVERVRGRQLQGWKSSKSGLGKRDPGYARGRRFRKIIAKKTLHDFYFVIIESIDFMNAFN
jgi:hypothetical protein